MKKFLLFGVICLTSFKIFAQGCTLTASAPKDTIICGEGIVLSAFGQAQGTPFLSEDFNTGGFTPGSGWDATPQAMFNNPCSSGGVDGTPHIWLGNSSPVPRALTTAAFNLNACANAGVTICYDMLFATQGNNAPCEGPDEPQEGVYLQYSIDGGNTWVTINYFDPNGGNDPQLVNWNNWCFAVPQVALTPGTKFRWFQDADSGADFDHWGIDNVVIYCNDSTYDIVWQHDGYNAGFTGGANPTPVHPRVTTSYPVVMSNGINTCYDTVTVFVNSPTVVVDAGPDTTICEGTCVTLNATAKVVHRAAGIRSFTNNQPEAISSTFGSSTGVNVNVQDLNMTNVLPNSIVSVCITKLTYFGVNINPLANPPIEIDHVGDLNLYLKCPDGTRIRLVPAGIAVPDTNGFLTFGPFSIPLSDSVGYLSTCFVPAGPSITTGNYTPHSGSYGPDESFNNLVGCSANGVWTVEVEPTSNLLGQGTLTGFSITFDDPELSYQGDFIWNPTSNMTGSNTLTPNVCPPAQSTTYRITVSDTAQCVTLTDSVTVRTQFCCNVSITSTSVEPACGASTGSINLGITPVDTNYTFAWGDGATTQSRTGLAAGVYSVTVTDTLHNCVKDTAIILNSAGNLDVTFPTVIQPTCQALSGGSITVALSGGTAPYNVTIDTGGTPFSLVVPIAGQQTLGGLKAMTVSITVTDASGCFAGNATTLNAPTNCCTFITSAVVTPPTCAATSGSIVLTVTNGSGNYSYVWAGLADTDNSVINLGVGTYPVTITDNTFANCSKDTSFTLSIINNLAVTLSNPVALTCGGGNNGAVTVNVNGGVAPYSVQVGSQTITLTAAGSQTINGLGAGPYTALVTDANGCPASSNTVNINPATDCCNLSFNTIVTRPACGASNGSIAIVVTSGGGNYTYSWSGGLGFNDTVSNLGTGSYSVTITDTGSPNCSADTTVNLNSNSNLSLTLTNVVNPSCGGGKNGQITIVLSGGTTPYSLSIDTNGTPQVTTVQQAGSINLTGLGAGTINVSVTDAAGCQATATQTFNANSAVSVNMNYSGLICFGTSTGNASAAVTGGTSPITYRWSNDSTTASVTGLPWGYIAVTVTDVNNCSASVSRVINQTNQLSFTRVLDLHLCEGNAYGNVKIYPNYPVNIPAPALCVVQGVGSDSVTAVGGDIFAEFTNIPPGNYTFTLTDSNGCSVSNDFLIPQSAANDEFTLNIDSTSCNGDAFNDGQIIVIPASLENGPYSYALNGGAAQADSIFSNLAAGAYDIVAVNRYGCGVTIPAIVEEPAPVSVNATPDTITTSPGVENAITVTGTNFTNPVYNWTPSSGLSCANCATPTAAVDSNTIFVVTVSDSLNTGCAASDSVVIIVTSGVKMPNAFTPNHDGHNDFFGPVMGSTSVIKEFRIYNRWGAMVHNSNQPWDGRFNGREQGTGTFVFYIVVDSPDLEKPGTMKSKAEQGSFTLLR